LAPADHDRRERERATKENRRGRRTAVCHDAMVAGRFGNPRSEPTHRAGRLVTVEWDLTE
jgi:hypothetical protein